MAMSTALPPSANSACSSGAGESAEYKVLQQCQMKRKEEWAVQDERGEEQPKKRCNHNLVMVSAEDFMMPEILQPIQTALAQEIDKFKVECEQWDPPNFEEEATDQGKPTFKLRNVYEHLQSIQAPGCHSTSTPAQKKNGVCCDKRTSCIVPQRCRFKCVALLAEEAFRSERLVFRLLFA